MDELIIYEEGTPVIAPEAAEKIASLHKEIKRLDDAMKEIKTRLFEEMKANDILKIDMPNLAITYVADTVTETLDTKQLKRDLPEIFNDYSIEKPRAGYVKITTRD